MKEKEFEYRYFRTEIKDNELECWQELAKELKKYENKGLVYLRNTPEVNYEKNYQTMKDCYQGFVRFIVIPQDFSTLSMPKIGEAK